MILQCDQCQTKFRLDDSKLKPGGVKVRCSKCKHVFVAGAEPKQEESDFDAILSGLGGPAPEKREAPVPPEQESPFGFDEEPVAQAPSAKAAPEPAPAPQAAPAPEPAAAHTPTSEEFPDFSSFDFAPEPAATEAKPAAGQEKAAEPAGFGFEETGAAAEAKPGEQQASPFEDFSFEDFGAAPEAKPAAAEGKAAAPESFDLGAFGAPSEEKPAGAEGMATPSEEFGFGPGDLANVEEPVVKQEQDALTSSGLDFGEFSFDEETPAAPAKAEPARPAAGGEFDFGDFDFSPEPATGTAPAAAAPEAEAAPSSSLDFGEFEFNPEPMAKPQEASPAAGPELDFGEVSFNEEPAIKSPETAEEPAGGPSGGKEFDFGDFSFEEEPPPVAESPAAGPAADVDFGTPAAPAPPEEFKLGDFSFGDEVQKPAEQAHAPAPEEDFALGEFSFDDEIPPASQKPGAGHEFSFGEPEPATASAPFGERATEPGTGEDEGKGGGVAAAAAAAAAGLAAAGAAAAGAASTKAAAKEEAESKPSSFDFNFGDVPSRAEGYEGEEELPPLSIASRRKGRSTFGIAVVAVAVLAILALTGAGLYLLQKGPQAMQTFNKMGLGFVGKWFGVEAPEEGKITIKNAQGAFYQNKEAGELFVVTGEAVNSYRKPRASIHVKVSIFDKKGGVLVQKTAYCGNRLSKEQLETLPMAKIDSIMNNQFGDSLSNLGVKPDQAIPFVVAVANVPKDAADFGVEVVGSTVAGQ